VKIVHIITGLQQGGAEAMLEKLITASAQHSPEVQHEVVSLGSLGVVGPRLQAAGVTVTALGLGRPGPTLRGLWHLFRLLRAQPRALVVQTWLYHGDLIGGLVARLAGCRRVYWNLRVVFNRSLLRRGTWLVSRLCAALSRTLPSRILACGPNVAESHIAQGYARERCVVMSNGFELERFAPAAAERARVRAELGIAAGTLVIGTVGRMHPQKDFPGLARAAAAVLEQAPATRFLWVGAGVDSDAELSRLLAELGIAHAVIRLGLRSDVAALLNAMDLFCLASRAEGFPNVLGEAMACALPCVSTDAGDAAFLMGDRTWVVPVAAPAALAEALLRMLVLDADARAALGTHNRERVLREFTIRAAWLRYLELYRADQTDPADLN
jgi:glycosyltransferase involved in cell wall biosynthesis